MELLSLIVKGTKKSMKGILSVVFSFEKYFCFIVPATFQEKKVRKLLIKVFALDYDKQSIIHFTALPKSIPKASKKHSLS